MSMKKRGDATSGGSRIQHMPVSGDHLSGSTTTSGSNLVFCPSARLFEGCGIQLEAPSGVTVATVLRLPSHASLRAHISQNEWLAAATTAFSLSHHVAFRLFEAFYVNSLRSDSRLETSRIFLDKVQKSRNDEYAQLTGNRTISLPGFMVFLMAQLLLERPPRSAVGELPQESIMGFLKQHLHEIISVASITKAGYVSQTDMQELDGIFREFANGTEAPFGTNIGFLWNRAESLVDVSVVTQFIRQRLVMPSDVKGSVAINANSLVTIRGISSTVHFSSTAPSPNKSHSLLKIQRCQQSSLYITAPLPNTIISGLANCVVVLGPVSGMLIVDHCEHCQIVALCGGVSVSNCKNVTLFLCSNSAPIVHTGADAAAVSEVYFAPYNTYYPTLEEHLHATGINPILNMLKYGPAAEMALPVEQFAPITVPITASTTASVSTRTNPCPLPPEYAVVLKERMETFNDTSKLLQDTYRKLESSGRRDLAESLRTKVHQHFLDWLVESGQTRGLVDLLQHTVAASNDRQ